VRAVIIGGPYVPMRIGAAGRIRELACFSSKAQHEQACKECQFRFQERCAQAAALRSMLLEVNSRQENDPELWRMFLYRWQASPILA